ncbi:WXG100 family type VII secretion target [Streptomyces sp. NPDC050161]|uniref:WXG100 family type VII secretion target n=1 Tax=Streptomyces sp. NPDC050161 TaxID=3365604 RepID=UPI0037A2D6DE
MATGSLTPAEFKVDLAQLRDAIGTVRGCTTSIESDVSQVKAAFQQAQSSWRSPAGESFGALQVEFGNNMSELVELLHEMVTRMNAAYEEYKQAEETNTENFHKKN